MSAARLLFCFVLMMLAGLGTWVVAADDAGTQELVQRESLGGLRLYLTEAQVMKLFGKPEKEGIVRKIPDGTEDQIWSYPSKGGEIWMVRRQNSHDLKIARSFVASAPCELSTKHGIRIGSSEESFRKAYAGHFLQGGSTKPNVFYVGTYPGSLIFNFEHGNVSQIRFDSANE